MLVIVSGECGYVEKKPGGSTSMVVPVDLGRSLRSDGDDRLESRRSKSISSASSSEDVVRSMDSPRR